MIRKTKQLHKEDTAKWERSFAYFPVLVRENDELFWVWWQWVERRPRVEFPAFIPDWEYRLVGQNDPTC